MTSAAAPAGPLLRPVTEEDVERIIAVYERTRHVSRTAEITRRSYGTVRKILLERELYQPRFPKPGADDIARMIDLYRQNRSVKQTARLTGWSHRRVKGVLEARNLYAPGQPSNPELAALDAEWKRNQVTIDEYIYRHDLIIAEGALRPRGSR